MKFFILNLKLLIVVAIICSPNNVFGATIFFDPPSKSIKEGEQFGIEFKIRVENEESINAVEGVLKFPKNILKIVDIDLTNSIIGAWIEKPKIKNDKIIFAGVVPGGFNGVLKPLENGKYPATLFKIVFMSKKEGGGVVAIEDVLVLKNDGVGSETESSTIPFAINILPKAKDSNTFDAKDLTIVVIITLSFLWFLVKKYGNFF